MGYTNIASPYMTGNWGPANYNFNKHSWTLFNRDNPNFSKTQFKVALQQLQQAGVLDSSRGYANEKLKAEVLRGTPGIASPNNPLGKYQGTGGNFGLKSYNAAKADNWSPQDIYDEIQSGRSGMFMPSGSMAQYMKDIAPPPPEPVEMPDIPLPGTQTGAHNVNNYSALGIRSPRPENFDLNTGGTTAAFGRKKRFSQNLFANALAINPLTQ